MQSHDQLSHYISERTPNPFIRSFQKFHQAININQFNQRGLTLIQQAAREGMINVVLLLLSAGADIDSSQDDFESKSRRDHRESKKTALYFAAANEDPLLAQLLIICGANQDKVKAKAQELKEPEVERFIETLKINTDVCYGIICWHIRHFSKQFDDQLLKRLIPYIQRRHKTLHEVNIEILDLKEEKKGEASVSRVRYPHFNLSIQQLTVFATKKNNSTLATQLNQLSKSKIDTNSDDLFKLTPAYHAVLNKDLELYNTLCGEDIEMRALTLAQLEWSNCVNQFDALIINEKQEVIDRALEISEKLKYSCKRPKPPLSTKQTLAYDKVSNERDFVLELGIKDFYAIAAYAYEQRNFIALNTILSYLDKYRFKIGDTLQERSTVYLKKDKGKLLYSLKVKNTDQLITGVITKDEIADLDLQRMNTEHLSRFGPDILNIILKRGNIEDVHQQFLKEILDNQNYSLALFWMTACSVDRYDFMLKCFISTFLQGQSISDHFWQTFTSHCVSFPFLRLLSLKQGVLAQIPPRFNEKLFKYANSFCQGRRSASLDLLECVQDQYPLPFLRFSSENKKVFSEPSLINEDQNRIHDIFLRFSLPIFFEVMLPDLTIKNLMIPPLWKIVISYLDKKERQQISTLTFLRECALQVEYSDGSKIDLKEKYLALSAFISLINNRLAETNWCTERCTKGGILHTSSLIFFSIASTLLITFTMKFDHAQDRDYQTLQSTINPMTNHTCMQDYDPSSNFGCLPFQDVTPISLLCEKICSSMEKNHLIRENVFNGSIVSTIIAAIYLCCVGCGYLPRCFEKNERFSLTKFEEMQVEFNVIFSKLKFLFPTEYDDKYIQRENIASALDLATKLLTEIKDSDPTLFPKPNIEESKAIVSSTTNHSAFFQPSFSEKDVRTPLLDPHRNTSI